MIFQATVTTPANTTQNSPLITTIKVCKGIIHQFDVYFPPGAQGLHRIILRRAVHQLIPTSSAEYLAGEGAYITAKEHIDISDEPTELTIHSWNLDDTYQHTAFVRLYLLRKNIVTPWLSNWREKFAS